MTITKNDARVNTLLPSWFNVVGDGRTSDTAKFAAIETVMTGRAVDLMGLTYAVSAIPTGNAYLNGKFAGPFEPFVNSSDLSQATWGKQRMTISGTALAIPTAVSGSHYVETPVAKVSDAHPFWFRVDGKADGYSILRIRLGDASGNLVGEARVNLTTGAIIAGSNVSVSAPDGSGYRRVDVPFTITPGVSSVRAQLWIYNDAGESTFAGNGTSGISMRNIAWGNYPYSAVVNNAMISSPFDTGGILAAYLGGTVTPLLPTVPGRSTPETIGTLWSQSCRAEFVRAVCVGSIYSHSKGNVSGNYSARECFSHVPQSVNIGSEESWAWGGFRAFNAAAFTSGCEGESNFNIGTRGSYAGGRNSGNIGSTGAYAGRGGGAKLAVTTVGGVLTALTIERKGSRYQVGDLIVPVDRSGAGIGGSAVVSSVDAEGGLTGIGSIVGGSGYSSNVDAFVDNGTGDFSGNLFNAGFTETSGEASAIIASLGGSGGYVKASGNRSVVMASEGASEASGNMSLVAASSGGVASGLISAAIAVNNSKASAQESIVFGRRTENPEVRSLAGGDAASGGPLSANRKWSISNTTGVIKSVTTFSASGTYADFGERVENLVKGVIPYGTIVMLVGDKIAPWDGKSHIRGVVSATIAFMGNDADFEWPGRWMKDDFGAFIYEEIPDPEWLAEIPDPSWPKRIANPLHPRFDDVPVKDEDGNVIEITRVVSSEPTIFNPEPAPLIPNPEPQGMVAARIENPEYDPTREMRPRSERSDEWSPVGLMGQVFVRFGKDVPEVGSWIGGRLQVMKITTPFDEEKGYSVAKCFI